MPHLWNLAGVHPDVIMVLLLMLMYDRFLGQIGERNFRPMILGSAIVPHLFAVLEDTREFPFFLTTDLLRMLAYAGTSMHLVCAICGPTSRVNKKFHDGVMRIILRRVVSCTVGNPLIASSLALSFSTISSYPLGPPVADIRISINPCLSPVCSIWKILSILSVLPSANAICRVSTEGFTPSQQEIFDNIYLVETIRQLLVNKAFIMICKFFHKQKKSSSNLGGVSRFEPGRHFCAEFEKLRQTPDFEEFMKSMRSLSVLLLQPCERKQPDFMLCWRIVEVFYEKMKVCNWKFMSKLLTEDDEDSVLKLLEKGRLDSEVVSPFSCSLSFLDYSANGSGLQFLSVLRRGIHSLPYVSMPEALLEFLHEQRNIKFNMNAKSQLYRIMHILCKFIKFFTADTPHRDFICSCIVFLKSNQDAIFRDLQIYLDLLKSDLSRGCGFSEIFADFCDFANTSMHCTEMTQRSFLCFFELMIDVLSHERFMGKFSRWLNELKKKREPINVLTDKFINQISCKSANYLFLSKVDPFSFTVCFKCNAHLNCDNYTLRFWDDNGLCDTCNEICSECSSDDSD